ncbi:MAG TPA: OmpW family outer membrane protein [Chitinophagaceae bacterium]
MKKLLLITILCIALLSKNNAQSFSSLPDKFFIGYEPAFPTGDFLSEPSWAGGRVEYRRMIKPNFSVGIAGSWNSFDEYVPRTTYQKPDGSGAVTTDLVKEIYTVPLTLSGHYYFKSGKKILPYAGLGLGTEYSDQTLYFNIFSTDDNNWGFVVRPEVGLIYPFSSSTALYLSGAYNYATNKNDAFNIDHLAHFAVSIGFVFSSR